jgi:hypothetical protein
MAASRSRRRRRLAWAAAILLAVYLGSYLFLSRRGDAWCRPRGCIGFFYALPTDTPRWWTLHKVCFLVYRPANWLDRELGTGRSAVTSMMVADPTGRGMWRCEAAGEFEFD